MIDYVYQLYGVRVRFRSLDSSYVAAVLAEKYPAICKRWYQGENAHEKTV